MVVDRLFPMGTFKVTAGPSTNEVSLFKPTRSTIVFTIRRPNELAAEYRVHHIRAGRFGRFGETEVAKAARELALAIAEKARPR
jgi:hypothetical protein